MIRTCFNKSFDPIHPNPDDIDINVLAFSLSRICRWNGHTKFHYSIAQHCMLVCDMLKDEPINTRYLALIHDASEAYVSDLLKPFKPEVKGYKEIEKRIEDAVLQRFGLTATADEWARVKDADNLAAAVEGRVLMGITGDCEGIFTYPENVIEAWTDHIDHTCVQFVETLYKQKLKDVLAGTSITPSKTIPMLILPQGIFMLELHHGKYTFFNTCTLKYYLIDKAAVDTCSDLGYLIEQSPVITQEGRCVS